MSRAPFRDRPAYRPTLSPTPTYARVRLTRQPPASVVIRDGRPEALEVLGLDPWNIIESLRTLVLRIWDMGWDAVRWLWRYLLLGAAVVVPIWLIVRLMRAAKGR